MTTPADIAAGEFAMLTREGPAAIATIRVCCDAAALDRLEAIVRPLGNMRLADFDSHRPRRAALVDERGIPIDDILVVIFADGTKRDIRLYLHGSPWLTRRCAALLQGAGFSASASLQDCWRDDSSLTSDAYRLLPSMRTERGATWLLRQPALWHAFLAELEGADFEVAMKMLQGVRRRQNIVNWFTDSARVAIVGPPNAGKSTLLNALAARRIALVSAQPGTTRDWIEVESEADGFPVTWIDTAGLRDTDEPIEAAGIARARAIAGAAEVIVLVLDATAIGDPAYSAPFASLTIKPLVVALNKIDLVGNREKTIAQLPHPLRERAVPVSAVNDVEFPLLFEAMFAALGRNLADLQHPAPFTPIQVREVERAGRQTDLGTMLKVIRALARSDKRPIT